MKEQIDLFRIVHGGTIYTLTSASEEQVYNLETYTPAPISRGGFNLKSELSKAGIEIEIALTEPLAQALLIFYGEQICTMTIFTNDGTDVSVTWKGRLATSKPAETSLKLNFESIFTSMRRPGLRARFQKSCRHALYHGRCTLNMDDFAVAATISAINGNVLTIPVASGQPNGFYTGGILRASDGTMSFIIAHIGTAITLQRASYRVLLDFATLGAATAVTIYPGCDHSRGTCQTKFNNRLNYGGFDWIPQKNPLGGSSIV